MSPQRKALMRGEEDERRLLTPSGVSMCPRDGAEGEEVYRQTVS
jgi:hypothetical protein